MKPIYSHVNLQSKYDVTTLIADLKRYMILSLKRLHHLDGLFNGRRYFIVPGYSITVCIDELCAIRRKLLGIRRDGVM